VTRITDFRQRKLGPTYGSFSGLVPLRTPSGPQETESKLEKELVAQLNFSPIVADLITQPIIEYEQDGRPREYAADIFVSLWFWSIERPRYYLIEVKREQDLKDNQAKYAPKFAAARDWCSQNFASFRVVTEKEIRTPYLRNTSLLGCHIGLEPDDRHFNAVLAILRQGARSVAELIPLLASQGIGEPDARETIEICVANRILGCDLTKPFGDDSILNEGLIPPGSHPYDRDPIINLLWHASQG
jgi:hypothetical protein